MHAAADKVGLVFFPAFDWAIEPDHPEREERLLYTRDQVVEEGLLDIPGVEEHRPAVAAAQDVQRAHVCVPSVRAVATESHLIAAGGTMTAADLVMTGKAKRSFALLRPPGHHAMRIVHGSRGFCAINNEAVMIEHIRHTYGAKLRIAVVDTDAHHADGTQDIYYNDPQVLHICLHQDGRTLYPGTGSIGELGGPAAFGLTLNVPLPPGTGDEGVLYVVEKLVLPVLHDFQPDLVINGAGQDNHYTDPLTCMRVTAHGYARLTEMLAPDIVVLEGGYSIEGALPYVNVGILLALAGLDYGGVREPDFDEEDVRQAEGIQDEIRAIVDDLGGIWAGRERVDLERIFGAGPEFTRARRIYYDTDEILERQEETIHRCGACPGYRVIRSSARRASGAVHQIAAVVIPWLACPHCTAGAEETYAGLNVSSDLDYVYLQDPERNRFETKSRRTAKGTEGRK